MAGQIGLAGRLDSDHLRYFHDGAKSLGAVYISHITVNEWSFDQADKMVCPHTF
jgi:hypothetical protein